MTLQRIALLLILAPLTACAGRAAAPDAERSDLGEPVAAPAEAYAAKRDACVKAYADKVPDRDMIADFVRHADRDWTGREIILLQCPAARERFRTVYRAPSQTAETPPTDAYLGTRAEVVEAYAQRLPALKARALGETAFPPLWWRLRAEDGEELWLRDDGVACGVEEAIFSSDLETARDLRGSEIWSRRRQRLDPEPGALADWGFAKGNQVRALERLVVESVEWACDPERPYAYRLARGGDIVGYYNAEHPSRLARDFFLADPRTLHPDWTAVEWEAIRAGEVRLGMTQEMVRTALGTPNYVRQGFEKKKPSQSWYYQTGPRDFRRLTFQDGKLVSSGVDTSQTFRESGILER